MPEPFPIRVVQRFARPQASAFAWLTDFDEADAQRAGAVVESRQVVERTPGRIVYKGETSVLGRRNWAVTEVVLQPPDRWNAKVTEGPRLGSFTHYHLVPDGPDACVLTVDYHFAFVDPRRHFIARLAKPLVRRELRKMWRGYAVAMERELPR